MMDRDFWIEKWKKRELGFHQQQVCPDLLAYHAELVPCQTERAKILVPLCGKTLALGWLREQGWHVVGVELSEIAVREYIETLAEEFEVAEGSGYKAYIGETLTIFQGDFFKIPVATLGKINAVYDRAALIALPPEMRLAYAARMCEILSGGASWRQLLVVIDYEEGLLSEPPFRVSETELRESLYAQYSLRKCRVRKLGERTVALDPSQPESVRWITYLIEPALTNCSVDNS